jgi:hypothetical protein
MALCFFALCARAKKQRAMLQKATKKASILYNILHNFFEIILDSITIE